MKTVYLLGATASGKHEAALLLADQLDAEIISIDSVKVYRGMDIGSAKPHPGTMSRIPHHLIDICDPSDNYNAGRFVEDAEKAEEDVNKRGKRALFAGGTALYYKAYRYGLFGDVQAVPELRRELGDLAREKGVPHLHEELKKVDPVGAERIHPNDEKRLIRALEVFISTGKRITSLQTQHDEPSREGITVWIDRTREDLRLRMTKRTSKMFEAGLEDEVKTLLGGDWGKEAQNAVGYREVVDMIQGKLSRPDAEKEINKRTDKFIRRQMTWFKSFPEAKGVKAGPLDKADQIAGKILAEIEK